LTASALFERKSISLGRRIYSLYKKKSERGRKQSAPKGSVVPLVSHHFVGCWTLFKP
jgi:hypothetical protein